MKVSRELADKVERYNELKKEAEKLWEEVTKWFYENTGADAVYIESLYITDKPTGRLQEEDEYCDQWNCGWAEDAFAGNYYHQIEGSQEYVGYSYST